MSYMAMYGDVCTYAMYGDVWSTHGLSRCKMHAASYFFMPEATIVMLAQDTSPEGMLQLLGYLSHVPDYLSAY